MKTDSMTVEVLADGSLKVSTDPVSAANHMGAENMLREMFKSLGGDVVTKHRHGKKMHEHTHSQGQTHKH
jgi:hypothetical protein